MEFIMYITDLFEAQNYEDMFKSVFDIAQFLPTEESKNHVMKSIRDDIKDAKKSLKKNDRIIWYLRIVKYKWLNQMYKTKFDGTGDQVREIASKIEKELNKLKKFSYIEKSANQALNRPFMLQIDHFLSLPIDKIQNYVWTDQTSKELLDQFTEFEDEWKDTLGENGVRISSGDEMVLQFDGGKKAWWLLDRGACREEGDKMGHCGNVPQEREGDQILSFRTATENPDIWVPHLTFIRDENDYLGEMKGRGNEKPNKKYHPYIVKLLLSKYVEGVKGGGYMPENNFQLNDLDQATREKLIERKPQLASLYDLYKKEGLSDRVKNKIYEKINVEGLPDIYGIEDDKVIVQHWDDFDDLLREIDYNKEIEKFRKLLDDDEGEIKLDVNELQIPLQNLVDMVDKLTDRTLAKIARRVNMTFDYSNYEDRVRLAEAIFNSDIFDEMIIPIIEDVIKQKQGQFSQHPKIDEFKEFMLTRIFRNNSRDPIGQLYDQHDNFEDIKLIMGLSDFMRMLDADGEDEDSQLKSFVSYQSDWFELDDYEFKNYVDNLYDEDDKELWKELSAIMKSGTEITDLELQDDDIEVVVNKLEKEFNLMDSLDYDRLKKLAGI